LEELMVVDTGFFRHFESINVQLPLKGSKLDLLLGILRENGIVKDLWEKDLE